MCIQRTPLFRRNRRECRRFKVPDDNPQQPSRCTECLTSVLCKPEGWLAPWVLPPKGQPSVHPPQYPICLWGFFCGVGREVSGRGRSQRVRVCRRSSGNTRVRNQVKRLEFFVGPRLRLHTRLQASVLSLHITVLGCNGASNDRLRASWKERLSRQMGCPTISSHPGRSHGVQDSIIKPSGEKCALSSLERNRNEEK